LFNPHLLIDIMQHPYCLSEHGLRLIQNNLTTKNLIQLIEQINTQLKYVVISRLNNGNELVQQTCVSIFLLTNVLHYYHMFVTTDQVTRYILSE
jgi:hypothetical protein